MAIKWIKIKFTHHPDYRQIRKATLSERRHVWIDRIEMVIFNWNSMFLLRQPVSSCAGTTDRLSSVDRKIRQECRPRRLPQELTECCLGAVYAKKQTGIQQVVGGNCIFQWRLWLNEELPLDSTWSYLFWNKYVCTCSMLPPNNNDIRHTFRIWRQGNKNYACILMDRWGKKVWGHLISGLKLLPIVLRVLTDFYVTHFGLYLNECSRNYCLKDKLTRPSECPFEYGI